MLLQSCNEVGGGGASRRPLGASGDFVDGFSSRITVFVILHNTRYMDEVPVQKMSITIFNVTLEPPSAVSQSQGIKFSESPTPCVDLLSGFAIEALVLGLPELRFSAQHLPPASSAFSSLQEGGWFVSAFISISHPQHCM